LLDQSRSRSLDLSLDLSRSLSRSLSLPLVVSPSLWLELDLSLSLSRSLSWSWDLSESQNEILQLQKQSQVLENSLVETLELFLEAKYQQQLLSGEELQQALNVAESSTQNLTLLGVLVFSSLICLLLLLRLRAQISMPLAGQLICFLPEECVAELGIFRQRLQSQKRSELLIRLLLLSCVIELFWVFYISIQIDNLWLPGSKKIDD